MVGQRAAGPREVERLAEAVRPQAAVDGVVAHPVAQAEEVELGDGARGQPVAAGLVAGEDRRVGEHDVTAGARRPRGRRGPRGSGADDEDFGALRGLGHARILARRPVLPEIGPVVAVEPRGARSAGEGGRGEGPQVGVGLPVGGAVDADLDDAQPVGPLRRAPR